MKAKYIIIPTVIIGFVACAAYTTNKKKAENQKAWLIDYIENDTATDAEKLAGKQALSLMSQSEINTLFLVLSYPDKNLLSDKLKMEYAKISEKYPVFT